MTFFEQELRRLFEKNPLLEDTRFIGNACYGRLTDNFNVKIHFAICGYAGQYEALQITLLHRQEGQMDSGQIRFGDLWGTKQVANPNFPAGIKPYIWQDDGDTSWYVYKPTQADYAQLSEVVNSYLAIFQEPTQQQHQRIGQSMG